MATIRSTSAAGPIREKLVIRYNEYKRFGSQTTVTFEP